MNSCVYTACKKNLKKFRVDVHPRYPTVMYVLNEHWSCTPNYAIWDTKPIQMSCSLRTEMRNTNTLVVLHNVNDFHSSRWPILHNVAAIFIFATSVAVSTRPFGDFFCGCETRRSKKERDRYRRVMAKSMYYKCIKFLSIKSPKMVY